LVDTKGETAIPRESIVRALEQMSILNRRIQAATTFASMANFELDSGKIETDLPSFFEDYILKVSVLSGRKRTAVEVTNEHPGLLARFNPMDVSIIVEILISNAKRAEARRITFDIRGSADKAILLTVADNGNGLQSGADPNHIFDMGYTTSGGGSGLGLYHVRQVLGEMSGSIEIDRDHKGRGFGFKILIAPGAKRR
jgi:signal transduction histidine kinase